MITRVNASPGYGPESDLLLVAELTVPLPDGGGQVVRASGKTKSLAERACAAAACDLLQQNDMLSRDKTIVATREERPEAPEERPPPCEGRPPAVGAGTATGARRCELVCTHASACMQL